MTDALNALGEPQTHPIPMRGGFIMQMRTGKRTHVFLPASYIPGARRAVTEEGRKMAAKVGHPIPTKYARLKPGDRLWVQEETAALIDLKNYGLGSKAFYKVELPGGHVPIPGGARGTKWKTASYLAKDLKREDSRYTLDVIGARVCRAWEITWEEVARESTHHAHQSKNAWWESQYGLVMPWASNPEVVSLDFNFRDGNIDSGTRWAPEPVPERQPNRYLLRMNAPAPGCPHERCPTPGQCLDTCCKVNA